MRSGVLTSVHTFASDPTRGVFLLAILVFFIGGSLALFALRAPALKQAAFRADLARGRARVQPLFLSTAAATVLVGTLYPLVLEAIIGDKISVVHSSSSAPWAAILALAFIMPSGPCSPGARRSPGCGAAPGSAALAAFVLAAVTLYSTEGGPLLAAVGCSSPSSLLRSIVQLPTASRCFASRSLRRLARLWPAALGLRLPRLRYGQSASRFSASCPRPAGARKIVALKSGDRVAIAGFELDFKVSVKRDGPNWRDDVGRSRCAAARRRDCDGGAGQAHVSRRQPAPQEVASRPSARPALYHLGDPEDGGAVSARVY